MILAIKNLENSLHMSVVGVTYVSRHYSTNGGHICYKSSKKSVGLRDVRQAADCRRQGPLG